MTALEFRREIEEKGNIGAAQQIGDDNKACDSIEWANALIWAYVQSLLLKKNYAAAAIILWGTAIFDPRPTAVKRVWRGINENVKILIQGSSAQGKSYTGICWVFLNWLADPEFTTVKLISTTGGHSKSNTYATVASLHKQSCVPLPGIVTAESISYTEGDKRACISIVRIKEGADNSGVLQGFHPLPRPTPHPVFGKASRVVAVLDEAEEIALGVWTGLDNMLSTVDSTDDGVRVMGFYNPKDITARTAQLAEPIGGWGVFDVESGVRGKDEWMSKEGWFVVRLDAKKTENVVQRKKIYEGFQTFEGYRALETKNGGNSLSYYTFGRGAYPPDSAVNSIIQQRVLSLMRGEFTFIGSTIKIGGVDIAIDGRDEAIYSAGRYGKAVAFRHLSETPDGKKFWDTITFPEERWVAQLDQQFPLPKGSAKIVGNAIKATSIKLGIQPGNILIDSTGNGSPVLNYLQIPEVWSPEVGGIDFGSSPTTLKILEQEKKTAEEAYEGIHTEVWFAVALWGEFGYLAISPSVRSEDLERELIGRRYILGAGEKMRVEKKEIYKARIGRSPDHADSFTIFVHRARTLKGEIASMTGKAAKAEEVQDYGESLDSVSWMPSEGV